MSRIGVIAAVTFICAICLAGVGSIFGSRYLPYPWNMVGPLLLTCVAGLVGAGATWLIDKLHKNKTEVDPVKQTDDGVVAS